MMSATTVNKKELIEWINSLEDSAVLENIKLLKDINQGNDWWNDISKIAKESIRQGEVDVEAGNVHSSETFWSEIERRRKKRD